MQVDSEAPRRRPLWRLFIAPVLLLIAAAAWSVFWFYAASEVGVRADAWRAQEAKSGRNFDCGKRTVAGFPFRLEISCENASVALVSQTASNTLFAAQARRDPGGRADLRSEARDRGVQGAGQHCRTRRPGADAGRLGQGARQRGGTAGGAAARLDRVRRCRHRSHQCEFDPGAGRRAPSMPSCMAASRTARRAIIP